MYSDAVRRRLEALNRGPLPATLANISSAPLVAPATTLPRRSQTKPSPLRPSVVRPIPGLIRRGEAVENAAGQHWRVCLWLEELWPGGEQLCRQRQEYLLKTPASPKVGGEQSEHSWFIDAFPHRTIVLDLETCGLAGSALFMVGLLRPINDQLAVELLLARNYAEEAALLVSLWERIGDDSVVVTFNGKSFDWPMVVDRSRRHLLQRGRALAAPRHIDLLYPARRRWRRQLPDCRLQTLEQCICGRRRLDDIPGNQIPAAYAHYVRTGFEREMDGILLHNAIDLVTLLDLALRLAG